MSDEIRIPKALKSADYYMQLKEKLKEQRAKIKAEEAVAYEINGEIQTYQQERLKPLVGRFFKTEKGDVFLITGVPQIKYRLTGTVDFNPYQIPTIIATFSNTEDAVIGKEIYIEAETVFSRAVDAADPEVKFLSEYTEITREEFAKLVSLAFDVKDEGNSVFTDVERLSSKIEQTEAEINLEVSKMVGNDEIISKINQTAEAITIDASRININGTVSANGNFKIDTNGNMEANNAKFNGGKIQLNSSTSYNNFTIGEGQNYDNDFTRMNGTSLEVYDSDTQTQIFADSKNRQFYISDLSQKGHVTYLHPGIIYVYTESSETGTIIKGEGVTTPLVTQTSLESLKKNFEEVEDATSIVKNSEVYKYNLKSEENTDKKHYGFVIGENYNTPDEVISKSGEGIDTYSMCSILWKAVQEQQETIEALQKEINNLKGE